MNNKNHIIDERQAYLDFVFGYDDTERICVEFRSEIDKEFWKFRIKENEIALTHWVEIQINDYNPNFTLAEDYLIMFWAGVLDNYKI